MAVYIIIYLKPTQSHFYFEVLSLFLHSFSQLPANSYNTKVRTFLAKHLNHIKKSTPATIYSKGCRLLLFSSQLSPLPPSLSNLPCHSNTGSLLHCITLLSHCHALSRCATKLQLTNISFMSFSCDEVITFLIYECEC